MRCSSGRRVAPGAVALPAGLGPLLTASHRIAHAPTAEQLRLLQSLPPEQREAVLQQLGSQAGAGGTSATPANRDQIVVTEPDQSSAAAAMRDNAAGTTALREARIKGREQVLIDLGS